MKRKESKDKVKALVNKKLAKVKKPGASLKRKIGKLK